MQHLNQQFLFSPSDLGNFLACEHLTQLELAVALREGRRPSYENAYAELLRRKGQDHEHAFLTALRQAGRTVVEVRLDAARDFESGTRRTAEAMRTGVDYVYQAVFFSSGWRGIADFLERVDRPSALGAWSYQVLESFRSIAPPSRVPWSLACGSALGGSFVHEEEPCRRYHDDGGCRCRDDLAAKSRAWLLRTTR